MQGLLELANVPYVGAGVLGSAVGMDKAVMKTLFLSRGLPVGPYLVALRHEWVRDAAAIRARVERELGYPTFVKPANLGSSVGISKAKSAADLDEAMAMALRVRPEDRHRGRGAEPAGDRMRRARQRRPAGLGSRRGHSGARVLRLQAPSTSTPMARGSKSPPSSSTAETENVRRLSIEAFRAVEGAGMARVDFLLNGETGEMFLNEVNTIPGFTTISMYPKMWEASGLPYPALIDRLITLAVERHAEKQQLRTSVT